MKAIQWNKKQASKIKTTNDNNINTRENLQVNKLPLDNQENNTGRWSNRKIRDSLFKKDSNKK